MKLQHPEAFYPSCKEILQTPLHTVSLTFLKQLPQYVFFVHLSSSVAKPPLFWAAPAPDGQGPGADSGSDLLGSAPAPGKKRRLRLHTLKIFILSFQKVNY